MLNVSSKELFIIFLSFFLTLAFRFNYISNNHFQFHFEQARDALVSQNIYKNLDLKIQGPSAGNTDGTIYHGVLYYYIIGLAYFLFSGNPIAASYLMVILSSTAVIPIHLIAKEVSKNRKVGYLSSFLFAFSLDSTQMGTHLQNISLATVSIPWLFYFAWRVFFKNEKKYIYLLSLVLGITHQFGIYLGYFAIPIIFYFFYQVIKNKQIKFLRIKELFIFIAIYLISISTMIIAQLKLWKAGIFTLNHLSSAISAEITFRQGLLEALNLYLSKLANSYITPVKSATLLIILISVFSLCVLKKGNKIRLYLLVWLLVPIILFILVPRKTYYMMVGLSPSILIIYALGISKLTKIKLQKFIFVSLLFLYITTNFKIADKQKFDAKSPLYVSAQLTHELELIDKTYELASGKDFSISTLTSPYGVNTTWAYLYNWYGQNKYGYKPFCFGPSQKDLPGEYLLYETNVTYPIHFTIIEPATVSEYLKQDFLNLQKIYSKKIISSYQFNEIILQQRQL